MRFRTTIESTGTNTTGIPVPEQVMEALGAGKRPAVHVTVGGHTYRSTVASMGGRPMISLSAENREAAGVAGGEEVDVDVELDTEPRTVEVPPELAQALAGEPEAKRFFDGLSYSKQRWHVEQVTSAKTDETRQRRVAKSLDLLRAGKAR